MNKQISNHPDSKFQQAKSLIIVSNRTERSRFLSILIPMLQKIDPSGLIKTGGLNSGNLLIHVPHTLHDKLPDVLQAIEKARLDWHNVLGETPKAKDHISDIPFIAKLYQSNANERYQNDLTRTHTPNNRDMIVEYLPTLNDSSIRKIWSDTLKEAEKNIYQNRSELGKLSESEKEKLSLKILEYQYNICPISFLIVQHPLMWYSEDNSGEITLHAHWSVPKEDVATFFQ